MIESLTIEGNYALPMLNSNEFKVFSCFYDCTICTQVSIYKDNILGTRRVMKSNCCQKNYVKTSFLETLMFKPNKHYIS